MDTEAPYVAPRKCTVVDEGEETRRSTMSSVPLSDFADAAAYVLIAEPGAGKTTAFESEAQAQGGTYVTVRNFLAYDDKTEWHGTTLYLDGLDEFRVGKADGRPPLDRIRRKLYNLNYPPFRLSCRWADWMAANDKEATEGCLTRWHGCGDSPGSTFRTEHQGNTLQKPRGGG